MHSNLKESLLKLISCQVQVITCRFIQRQVFFRQERMHRNLKESLLKLISCQVQVITCRFIAQRKLSQIMVVCFI